MFNYLQRIGKSLMLPIAVLPAAALLIGIGYWIDPSGMGQNNIVSAILVKGGSALIDNMGILFAISISYGMSKDQNGAAAITGLVGWLVVQTLLSPETVSLMTGTEISLINPAFKKIDTQFIGILIGIISASVYNKTYKVELPKALSFFSGRRLSSIVNAFITILISAILFLTWPVIFNFLVSFGEMISGLGSIGAGLYGFFNRLLIPFGLHHALNSVFWFDVAGIDDIPKYLNGVGTPGVTGIYMAGFFPIMMFGLPAAALAMYHEALPSQKAKVGGIFLAAGIACFFTGVTEPLEFAFMFIAPVLFVIHAALTGISLFIAASFQWISGFSFSAGLVDYVLSFQNKMAVNKEMLLVLGLIMAVFYYIIFRFCIRKFNIKTLGREEQDNSIDTSAINSIGKNGKKKSKHLISAEHIIRLVGEKNIISVENCATRLRLVVSEDLVVDSKQFKDAGFAGTIRPNKKSLQIIVGPTVEFVCDELKTLLENR